MGTGGAGLGTRAAALLERFSMVTPGSAVPLASELPEQLVSLDRWLGRNAEKKPCCPATGAKTGWPKATTSFEQARQGVIDNGLAGLSFSPAKRDGVTIVDFDKCIVDGVLDPAVEDYLKWFSDTYCEISPSGTGLRLAVLATLPGNIDKHPIPQSETASLEMYDGSSNHAASITGNRFRNAALKLSPLQSSIDKILGPLGINYDAGVKKHENRPIKLSSVCGLIDTKRQDLRLATRQDRFKKLYALTIFSAQAFAAELLKDSEENIKAAIWNDLRECFKANGQHREPDKRYEDTRDDAWENGKAQPLRIAGSDKERADALKRIDDFLSGSAEFDQDDVLDDAATLSTADYDKRRKKLASRLGFTRPSVFDDEVAKRRPADDEEKEELQGTAIEIKDDEPWKDPVNGAKLLDEISALFRKYVYFPKQSDADAAALFLLGTYCFDNFALFPFLGVSAAAENSGKTTLGKVIKRLAFRPIPTNNVTPAALFRLIAMHQGTLIIDEMDTFLNPESELYGILNSGHDKEMAFVIRTVGEDHDPRNFNTWCPRAWCMIGLPKRTVTSRSIIVQLLRKPKDIVLERLPKPDQAGPEWKRLRQQCVRWCADNREKLRATTVSVSGLENRASDNWEPLFTIAQIAGTEWVRKAQLAAGVYHVVEEEARNITLLRDVRNILFTRRVKNPQMKFGDKGQRISCASLTSDLLQQSESPWPHFDHHQPMTINQLGSMLTGLGVKSTTYKAGDKTVRGFYLSQFQPLFDAYLTDEPETETELSVTGSQSQAPF